MIEHSHLASDAGPENRPVALLISKQRIVGPTNGSSAYVLALANTVKQAGFDVWLIQPSAALAGRTPILRFSEEMSVFARHEVLGMERIGRFAVSVSPAVWWGFLIGGLKLLARKVLGDRTFLKDRPRPYSIALPWQASEHLFVEQFAQEEGGRIKLALADYVFCSDAFGDLPQGTQTAIIMHDLFCRRDGKGADSVASLSEETEVSLLQRADWIIAIQKEERDFVQRTCPQSEALLAAMPAEVVAKPRPGEDDRLLFIGSDTAPNNVGLKWFCDEVWPQARAARPHAELNVVGTVGRKFDTGSIPGVNFLGLVEDLEPHYVNAGVLISPLTFGSGLKIKLIEAMGHGKAVVATSTTLQGVEEVCAGSVICEDDPESMAAAIIALAGDETARRELGEKALAVARESFSSASVHRELRERLLELSES